MRRFSMLALAITLSSCTGDDGAADASAPDARAPQRSPDEGDWFVCADEACSELRTTGLRLADHYTSHLIAAEQADGRFTEGDPYCVDEPFGTYELDGSIVTLTLHDGGLMVQTVLEIDDAGRTAHGGDMRKVEENATGRWDGSVCVSD